MREKGKAAPKEIEVTKMEGRHAAQEGNKEIVNPGSREGLKQKRVWGKVGLGFQVGRKPKGTHFTKTHEKQST